MEPLYCEIQSPKCKDVASAVRELDGKHVRCCWPCWQWYLDGAAPTGRPITIADEAHA
jgi:hypothetical protein